MDFLSRLCSCFPAKRSRRDRAEEDSAEEENPSDLFFDLRSLQIATNFFSELNQLGHGGFGPVYKGLMPSGQEIAVKKLSLESRQGPREFINEVKLLLKIQHKNLVMLLGCCAEGPEKMLVYEYLPNKSLDYFLFDKAKSASLDWQRRYQLVAGVSRGLLYLHDEAPHRIIHRDIKASNILLDEEMNPKISDFGLARLFPGEGTHTETSKISGTRGYMAPEYAMRGILSVKTDVFSFGILVLEIVSGRKNHDGRLGVEKADLLSYTWALFQRGMVLELVDPTLAKCNPDEATLCIQLGLLCCQACVSDRPDMISAHLMLSGDCADSLLTLPRPGKPAVQGRQGRWSTINPSSSYNTSGTRTSATSGSSMDDYSRNSMSISSMGEGR